MDGMKMNGASYATALAAESRVASRMKTILCERFSRFSEDIYKSMKWFDPQYWIDGGKTYGNDQITEL